MKSAIFAMTGSGVSFASVAMAVHGAPEWAALVVLAVGSFLLVRSLFYVF